MLQADPKMSEVNFPLVAAYRMSMHVQFFGAGMNERLQKT